MKRSSLQWKLTLWFSAALVLMAVLTFIVVFFVSHSVLQKQLRTELIHTVEDNVDEVEFYRSIAQMDQDGDTDHYIRYGVGYLEIDDDFLDQVNGMTTALYHENGSLLYGENPIAAAGMLAFEDGVCRTVRVRGETWYIFDRRLEQNTLRDLWLRGAVPETRADAPLRDIVYVCVWSLLALTLIAIAGGAKRELMDKPISQQLAAVMESRSVYRQESGGSSMPVVADDEKYCVSIAAPVISEGDLMGCVMFITPRNSIPCEELEYKLAQTVSSFLGKQMES